MSTLKALASDISEGLKVVKHSGSNEKRAAFRAFTSLAFGENIKKTRARKSLGKLVNIKEHKQGDKEPGKHPQGRFGKLAVH